MLASHIVRGTTKTPTVSSSSRGGWWGGEGEWEGGMDEVIRSESLNEDRYGVPMW